MNSTSSASGLNGLGGAPGPPPAGRRRRAGVRGVGAAQVQYALGQALRPGALGGLQRVARHLGAAGQPHQLRGGHCRIRAGIGPPCATSCLPPQAVAAPLPIPPGSIQHRCCVAGRSPPGAHGADAALLV